MNNKIERLKEIIEQKGRLSGKFTLTSGLKVDHYFDLKKMVLSYPEGMALIGDIIYELVTDEKILFVGGYGIGAHLIADLIPPLSWLKQIPIYGFEIWGKNELKKDDPQRDEDTQYVIKGHFPPAGGEVALIDDVISTGKSIFVAIEIVESRRCRVAAIRTILDRQLGGSEELSQKGYNFRSIFRTDPSGNVYTN